MVAYGGLYFFWIAGLVALPALILGFLERRIRAYALVASLVMAFALMADNPRRLAWLLGFLVYQVLLQQGWLRYRTTHATVHRYLGRAAALAATAPLFAVKATALWPNLSIGFLGVSYLSFRSIQVILEISDGLIKELKVADYLAFVLFFPTLSSGPIDRSRRFAADANRVWTRAEYGYLVARGVQLIVLGAVYKFALAAWFASLLPWASGWPRTLAWMYLYSGQLFFDFAGYSAMAVGMSYIFGIRTPMNFRMPFASENIKEFWNRWHISLSFWFRDYLYTRMTMYLMKKKVFSHRLTAGRVAMVANMTLMGFWHGFTLHYVLYGLYHGVLLVANDVYEKKSRLYRHRDKAWYRVGAILVTSQLVIFGFLIFSGHLIKI